MSTVTIHVNEYVDTAGHNSFGDFFDGLAHDAAAKVTGAIEKMAAGHTGGLKNLKDGLREWKIDWGPGLRIYVHVDGDTIILLMGGSYGKGNQSAEISDAKALVAEYKVQKKARLKAEKEGKKTPKKTR